MTDRITYPDTPGWKGDKDTGRKAAFAIAKDLPRRHRQVLSAFEPYGSAGTTCDQIGVDLELPVYLVRPRASELERKGRLWPVGKRPGAFGHSVTIYTAIEPAAPVAEAA